MNMLLKISNIYIFYIKIFNRFAIKNKLIHIRELMHIILYSQNDIKSSQCDDLNISHFPLENDIKSCL